MCTCTGGQKCRKHLGKEGSAWGHEPSGRNPGPDHRHPHAVERSKLDVWLTLRLAIVKRYYVAPIRR